MQSLPAVIAALGAHEEEGNTETASKARLLMAVLTSSFIVVIVNRATFLSLTLESPAADLV